MVEQKLPKLTTRVRFPSPARLLSLLVLASLNPVHAQEPASSQALTANAAAHVRTTEEGQRVLFDRATWQRRELAKRLPLDRRWPAENEIDAVFEEFGLKASPVPEFIPAPLELAPGVYLVNGRISYTYLIDCGPEGLAVIDPGLDENFQTVIANVEKLGFSRKKIRWVINTHAHFDHAMASRRFRDLGAQILIGADDADAIEKNTRVTASFLAPSPDNRPYPLTTVDWRLADGEELRLGNKTLHAIHTPGHSVGSFSFLLQSGGKNILFTGDTLFYDHRLPGQSTAYGDDEIVERSLAKLARFTLTVVKDPVRWDILAPGHGAIVLDRAYMDVEKGWRAVQLDRLQGGRFNSSPFATDRYRKLMFGRP